MITNDKEYLEILREYKRYSRMTEVPTWADLRGLKAKLEKYEELKGDKDRIGNYMFTVSGIRIWPEDPRPEEIDARDIAYGLARINRFNGMSAGEPYTVGLHCLYGSYLIDPKYALHFLLHDAQEYICHDIMTQIKRVIGDKYKEIEGKLERVIAEKFKLTWTEEAIKAVKEMDDKMLATEVEHLTYNKVIRMDVIKLPYASDEVNILQFDWQDVFVLYLYRLGYLSKLEEIKVTEYEFHSARATECQLKQSIHRDLIRVS